ncbi:MAG: AI-2E family transporter [Gemmatimonadales bacterium]
MAVTSPDGRRSFPIGRLLLAVALVALAIRTVDVLLVLFLAVILAIYLNSLAELLHRRLGMPQPIGLGLGVAATLGALVGVVLLIAPPVTSQVQDLLTNLPRYLASLDANLNGFMRSIPVLRRGATPGADGQPGLLATALSEILTFLRGAAVPYLKGGVEVLIEGVSVLVMAIFLARHPAIYVDGVVALAPPPRRPLVRAILRDLNLTIRAWVIGQIIAMVLLAALTTLGLWALGVPYFLAFGVFAGVAAIVPFFGVLLSTLVPALFALGAFGVTKALLVGALGVVVHIIEANFVAPVVMERQVNLPPVVTIAGVLLIGKLFGLAGLIIAVPILALVMILVRHILLGEVYGDPISATQASGTVSVDAEPTLQPTHP